MKDKNSEISSDSEIAGKIEDRKKEESPFLEFKKPPRSEVVRNLLLLILAVAAAYFVVRYVGMDGLREKAEQAGMWGPLLLVFLKALTIVAAPLSGLPVYVISGALYGFWKGVGIMFVGDAIGATAAFYISRLFGMKIVLYFLGKDNAPMLYKIMERMGEMKTYLKARIFFAGFPEIFAFASGLTAVSFAVFLPIYMLVHAVVIMVLVYFGDVLVSGNFFIVALGTVLASALAFAGAYWFYLDIKRGM